MKVLFKRLYKSDIFRAVLCWLIASYIRFVYYTSRIVLTVEDAAQPYMRGELPAVYSFWHGRLLMMPMICPPKRRMHVLISAHRDGVIIASAMHHFDFGTISGSSSRGGATAAIKSVKLLQAGENVSITPDGPRGPAMQAQEGIITIAQTANVPVLCVTYSSTRHKRARSWDRFMIALPFGRIYYKIGLLTENISQKTLDAKMNLLTQQVDELANA